MASLVFKYKKPQAVKAGKILTWYNNHLSKIIYPQISNQNSKISENKAKLLNFNLLTTKAN